MQDKSLLQKYAFVEYFKTALKYADILEPVDLQAILLSPLTKHFWITQKMFTA